MKALPLMLTAMVALGISAPSFAAPAPTRIVEYRAAELQSPEGRASVEARIEQAARQVCNQNALRGFQRRAIEAQCQEDALRSAHETLYGATSWMAGSRTEQGHVTFASRAR
ncbi:MAG: UrcA family protein [Glycocaulis sp.]|uniref:UrcA family protein n=1 Tax=Glycocaulis sp. TaxID=1969725 RepID=UPI003F70A96A